MRIPSPKDSITNLINLSLSYSYDKYDNVETIHIKKDKDTYQIEAMINVLGETFASELTLDEKGLLLHYGCECKYCDGNSPCAHIGAALLKLEKLEVTEFPFQYVSDKPQLLQQESDIRDQEIRRKQLSRLTKRSHNLIEYQKNIYKAQINTLIQNKTYEIEPILKNTNSGLSLSFKVGSDYKYVIKNISDFIDCTNNHSFHKYGKNLEFVHDIKLFDEFSQNQIQFMIKANDFSKRYLSLDYRYQHNYYPPLPKDINLEKELIDMFFDLYYGKEYETFSLEYLDEKISLNIKEEDGYYRLSLQNIKNYNSGKKFMYLIKRELDSTIIYRYNSDDSGMLTHLIKLLDEDYMFILKEEFNNFYKYILAPIENYIEFSQDVLIEQNKFEIIRLYCDINDNNEIVAKLDYIDDNSKYQKGFDQQFLTNYSQDLVENYISHYAKHIDYDNHIAYLDENDEKTYEFLKEGLVFLSDYCQIYVSESLKKIGETTNYSIVVGVKLESNLLDIDIDSEQIPKEEISHVLESYHKKKKFYRLKNGELLYLDSPQLEELDQFMNQYHMTSKDIDNGKTSLQSFRMFSINKDADELKYIKMDREESFQDAIVHFDNVNVQSQALPNKYNDILRSYQKDGFQWLHLLKNYGFNGILADDMGLGKTLQVIALLESIKEKRVSLVVCPSSLIYNWEEEVHKFTQDLNTACITGNGETRKEKILNASQYQLIITSYDYMRRDIELYKDIEFEYVILDEAQYIKNQKTKNAISVKMLKSRHKLALTGTPIENSLAELWSIFDFLMPQYLFNYHYFLKNYESEIVKNNNQEKVEQLKKLVTPFILRRNKKDVLKELPDKIEKTQFVHFTDEENKIYLANLAQVNTKLQDILGMENIDKIVILAMLTKLRQLCCEARLVYDNIQEPSSKMKACIELISSLKENSQKVILFSSFTSVLELIEKELSFANISYYVLTGKTSKEERRNLVKKFQEDDTSVFLISLKAGGTGLNLTSAQAVIHYDPWWNISAQNQATDRAYRIGQKNKVQVFKLVMKNSIEEKIMDLQNRKGELADVFIENNNGSISNMSKADILELFSIKE